MKHDWIVDRAPTMNDTHDVGNFCVEVTYTNGMLGWEPVRDLLNWTPESSDVPVVAWRRIRPAYDRDEQQAAGSAESKTVAALNAAFEADPNAIHSLICNRVPCNSDLAEDPFVVVESPPVLRDGNWQVGAMGLINGVLAANGLPLVASKFTDEQDSEGRVKLLGFCEYVPAKSSSGNLEKD